MNMLCVKWKCLCYLVVISLLLTLLYVLVLLSFNRFSFFVFSFNRLVISCYLSFNRLVIYCYVILVFSIVSFLSFSLLSAFSSRVFERSCFVLRSFFFCLWDGNTNNWINSSFHCYGPSFMHLFSSLVILLAFTSLAISSLIVDKVIFSSFLFFHSSFIYAFVNLRLSLFYSLVTFLVVSLLLFSLLGRSQYYSLSLFFISFNCIPALFSLSWFIVFLFESS